MGFPRDIVQFFRSLGSGVTESLFDPKGWAAIAARPEVEVLASRANLIQKKNSLGLVQVFLQSLAIQSTDLTRSHVAAEFVATLPAGFPGVVRSTRSVVSEMLSRANIEVVALGYEITEPNVISSLQGAAAAGAKITIICDRGRNSAAEILRSWPATLPKPRVFHDTHVDPSIPFSKMHCKALLIDGNELLVTSANFTFHGLEGNIEFGVRLRGGTATEALKVFSHLIEMGLVEEVTN